jgi:hypothetical protein
MEAHKKLESTSIKEGSSTEDYSNAPFEKEHTKI